MAKDCTILTEEELYIEQRERLIKNRKKKEKERIMECPYCGAELECIDYYGIGNQHKDDFEKLGNVYKCPQIEGFEDIEDVEIFFQTYYQMSWDEYVASEDCDENAERDLVCPSQEFNGYFYDRNGELFEGYPC